MLRRFLLVILLALILSTLQSSKVEVSNVVAKTNQNSIQAKVAPKKLDDRAHILRDYLAKYNSPLQNHAQDFIDAADTYNLDWRLMPAISGVESTFGKASYGYNGWGWGGSKLIPFNSWRDSIFTISKGLRENYVNKGLTEPYAMNRVYAASPSWGSRVTQFMNDMYDFSKKYPQEEESEGTYFVEHKQFDNNVKNNSAKLNESFQLAYLKKH